MLILFLPTLIFCSLWFFRNFWVANRFLGDHQVFDKLNPGALFENIQLVFYSLLSQPAKLVIALLFLFGFFASWFFVMNTTHQNHKIRRISNWFYTLIGTYILLLLFQTNISLNQLPRYLSIIWVPTVLIVPVLVQKLSKLGFFKLNLAQILLFLFAGIQLGLIGRKAMVASKEGAGGFQTKSWQDPNMKKLLISQVTDEKKMSNFPDYIWLTTHKKCSYTMFLKENRNDYLQKNIQANSCIWFKDSSRASFMVPENELVLMHHFGFKHDYGQFVVYTVDTALGLKN